jgi:hypothetical protein
MDRDKNFIGYTPSEAAKKKSDRSSNAGFSDPQTCCTVLGDNFIKCIYIFLIFILFN